MFRVFPMFSDVFRCFPMFLAPAWFSGPAGLRPARRARARARRAVGQPGAAAGAGRAQAIAVVGAVVAPAGNSSVVAIVVVAVVGVAGPPRRQSPERPGGVFFLIPRGRFARRGPAGGHIFSIWRRIAARRENSGPARAACWEKSHCFFLILGRPGGACI